MTYVTVKTSVLPKAQFLLCCLAETPSGLFVHCSWIMWQKKEKKSWLVICVCNKLQTILINMQYEWTNPLCSDWSACAAQQYTSNKHQSVVIRSRRKMSSVKLLWIIIIMKILTILYPCPYKIQSFLLIYSFVWCSGYYCQNQGTYQRSWR